MKAIIIEEKDAQALINNLKLARLERDRYHNGETDPTVENMHRIFYAEVIDWFKEQGANVSL